MGRGGRDGVRERKDNNRRDTMTKQTARNILEAIAYMANLNKDMEISYSVAVVAISLVCDGDLMKMIDLVKLANKTLHENSFAIADEIDAMRRESKAVH